MSKSIDIGSMVRVNTYTIKEKRAEGDWGCIDVVDAETAILALGAACGRRVRYFNNDSKCVRANYVVEDGEAVETRLLAINVNDKSDSFEALVELLREDQ